MGKEGFGKGSIEMQKRAVLEFFSSAVVGLISWRNLAEKNNRPF